MTMSDHTNPSPAATAPDLQEEASRYALLRRLTPTLRHHMVGEFQPIGMLTALMERRLQAEPLNLPGLRDNCQSIGNLSRSAAESCLDLMSWLAPRQASLVVPLAQGASECLSLLATSLRFRGFVLVNQLGAVDERVSGAALRSVLPAALLALSDAATGPCDLIISAAAQAGAVALTIELRAVDRPSDNQPSDDYRPLRWQDVQALAQAESVQLSRQGDSTCLTLATQA